MYKPLKPCGKAHNGNALMEYALPAAMLILGFAVINQMVNIQGLMGAFYTKANGDPASQGTYRVAAMGSQAQGVVGTGINGFGSTLKPSTSSQLLGLLSTPPTPLSQTLGSGTSLPLNATCYATDNCQSGLQKIKTDLSAALTSGQQAADSQNSQTQAQIDTLVAQRDTLLTQLASEVSPPPTTTP